MLTKVRDRLTGIRADSPAAYLRDGGSAAATTTVVTCVGDSLTHGSVSANYVDLLRARHSPADYTFINAGINGNLAWNVLQRLGPVIGCRPDVVTLLIGTNDVNATFNEAWQRQYRREQRLPVRPDLAWYCENVSAILDRLAAETEAQTVVLDIPMLGEDLASTMNQRVDEYNAALRRICSDRQVPCLPLHATLAALLPPGHLPPAYTGSLVTIGRAFVSHALLRRSWTQIAHGNGLAVLTDHLHFSEPAAEAVADLIEPALTGV